MRVFFAVEFEDNLKEYLNNIQKEVRQHCSAGNFTLKENFHLTLRFIGEQNQSQTDDLKMALKETATNISAFELMLNKLGSFDKGNRKIIWAGLQKSPGLDALYNKLENVLVKHGYKREDRGFNPHITLAREVRIEGYENLVNKVKLDSLAVKVKSISLMESTRIDNKLCYMPIARYELDILANKLIK